MRWSHAALNCRDIAATEDFYTRWFGFRRAHDFDLGDVQIVFLRQGDAYLELFSVSEPDGGSASGGSDPGGSDPGAAAVADGPQRAGQVRHLAFQTDDVDGFLQRLGPAARVSLGPLDFHAFIPGWRTVWLTDPDGTVVEVSQGYRDRDEPAVAGG